MPKKRTITKKHIPAAPAGYRDIFGVRDAHKGPLVLLDGTSMSGRRGGRLPMRPVGAGSENWRSLSIRVLYSNRSSGPLTYSALAGGGGH
jgi:hypothetical protein